MARRPLEEILSIYHQLTYIQFSVKVKSFVFYRRSLVCVTMSVTLHPRVRGLFTVLSWQAVKGLRVQKYQQGSFHCAFLLINYWQNILVRARSKKHEKKGRITKKALHTIHTNDEGIFLLICVLCFTHEYFISTKAASIMVGGKPGSPKGKHTTIRRLL